MKLIIDIPNYNLDAVKNGSIACGQILEAVKNGIPYNDDMKEDYGYAIPVDSNGCTPV